MTPETIERATLDAVPPQAREEVAGWLAAFDRSTIGRAHSAAPLRHEPAAPQVVDALEARYAHHGLAPVLRIARLDCFAPLHADLEARGYRAQKPTVVQVAQCDDAASLEGEVEVEFTDAPSARWAEVYVAGISDAQDAASRIAVARRAQATVFATVLAGDEVAAVGSACFSQGWCGIHRMRTAPAFRGRGYARGIVAALAREALQRGVTRAYLQVEQDNAPARSVYARAGFQDAWTYEYWQKA